MFFTEPQNDEVSVVIPSQASQLGLTIAAVFTVLLGVIPTPVLNLLSDLVFLR
jgi:NADH-quinone oxidoreductase subunit N